MQAVLESMAYITCSLAIWHGGISVSSQISFQTCMFQHAMLCGGSEVVANLQCKLKLHMNGTLDKY